MHVYHYCFCLLAFFVLVINSRYLEQSLDNEVDGDFYHPDYYHLNHYYRPNSLERYIRNWMVSDLRDDDRYDVPTQFQRRTKAITKGDPREFMG